jgi:hypothetical protein
MKTAVEWFYEKYKSEMDINGQIHIDLLNKFFDEAKEMEKQQLYNFYVQGGIDCVTQADRTIKDYYNETYKSE